MTTKAGWRRMAMDLALKTSVGMVRAIERGDVEFFSKDGDAECAAALIGGLLERATRRKGLGASNG